MKKSTVLISGVIAALVLILFLAYPYLNQSFLAVAAICVTLAVLVLAIPSNLFSWLKGNGNKAGFIKSTYIAIVKKTKVGQ
ncbi:hypothetical protein P0F74_004576 [Salmonella enterica]|nr:hypothetical protein [Salmonella enterica]ELS8927799.1 hypothetical protein [Salmonella enterica]